MSSGPGSLTAPRWGRVRRQAKDLEALEDAAKGGCDEWQGTKPNWLRHRIIESAPDGIVMADRDGTISLWNGGAETVFGCSADEAVGQSLDLIIPDRFRERHWSGFRKAYTAAPETVCG